MPEGASDQRPERRPTQRPEPRRERGPVRGPLRALGRPLAADELLVIAGPCIIEGAEMALAVAAEVKRHAERLGLRYVFKASYRKDNRSSVSSFTGIGDAEGLAVLRRVRRDLDVPVLTDVHAVEEVGPAAEVCDVLQVPAFLSRQTRLLQAAAQSGRPVNVKKGQFLAPDDLSRVVEKLRAVRPEVEVWLTERGTTFGYHNLVVDMRVFAEMRALAGVAAIYDVTHSLQHPGTGGDRRHARPLARAALAAGADGLFFETHPDPPRALSDPTTQLPLSGIGEFLEEMVEWKRLQARFAGGGDAGAGEAGGSDREDRP